ncbi:hypothetical protein ZIOFF_037230 [Zingiber officinale]|uniref:Uncharacterized protein n=1 Tax=Zingiber officinale TaxID=94328 RepID=A0A8J5L3Z0_ZINOF|nr:hypothetical protein ZIOFF_037230 [Zingiber officinale]
MLYGLPGIFWCQENMRHVIDGVLALISSNQKTTILNLSMFPQCLERDKLAEIRAMGGSWVRIITSPFRKAYTIISSPRDKKSQAGDGRSGPLELHGEVMACAYEDVRVMWSMLDKTRRAGEHVAAAS